MGKRGVMKKPKVLFIASQPFFQWRGSPIRLGFDVMALAESGYGVTFLTLPIGERREVPGVRIVRAPRLPGVRNVSIGPSLPKLVFDFLMFWMGLWIALRERPAVVHGVEDCGVLAVVIGRLTRARVVFEKHSDPSSYGKRGAMGVLMRLYAAVEHWVIRHADAVIGTGAGLVEQVAAFGRGTPGYHIFDIPSSLAEATDAGTAAARDALGVPAGAVVALYVGSFAVYQGIDLLFDAIPEACAHADSLYFAIIGGNTEQVAQRRSEMEAAAVSDRVRFVGKVSPDVLPDYLCAADVLLSPRLEGVNTPLKILDYFKAGRAIAATDTAANRLLLDEGNAALLPVDAAGFGGGVAALAKDAPRRQALAGRGRQMVEETYNYGEFKSRLAGCYHDLLGADASSG
jgi:glycosyltransferase involved in cell wall biosynthesis